ncbi:gluzincin family metallopeptidase [Salinactinospora qingdaonensis]
MTTHHTTAIIPETREAAATEVPAPTVHRLAQLIPQQARAQEPTRPLPQPSSLPVGPRMLIYKQDPLVRELGIRSIFVPSVVLNGPTDVRVTTRLDGVTPVTRDSNGDFLFPPNTARFDCAHTFGVVRETLTMLERLNGEPVPFAWNTNGNPDPITVFPRAGEGANAYYSRTARALKFLHFTPEEATSEVMACRSLDIVAHEAGHALLDGLKPGWLAAESPPQTGGLHESFGDLCAVFLVLSQADQVEALVARTKCDLHATSFLSWVGEEFGTALGKQFGLRNADNDLRLSEVGNEVHAISQVFTGAVYDVLADVFTFEYKRRQERTGPTLVLMEVASQLCSLLLGALKRAPEFNADYTDVVNEMLRLSQERGDPPIYRTFIRNRFAVREVVTSPTPMDDLLSGRIRARLHDPDYTGDSATPDVTEVAVSDENSPSLQAAQDRSACCGTMQLPEFQMLGGQQLAANGSLEDADILAEERRRISRSFTQ